MNNIPNYKVKLANGATLPKQATVGSAGYDLHALLTEDVVIPPQTRVGIPTGLHVAIPQGIFGQVTSRSGLAFKHNVDVKAGTIDSDYRGDVRVLLENSDLTKSFTVKNGDRIAQILFLPYVSPVLVQVSSLDSSVRGEDGFGSTGV